RRRPAIHHLGSNNKSRPLSMFVGKRLRRTATCNGRSDMSWQDIMRRVLPPIGGVPPHPTSAYGATNRPPNSTNPHRGVDFKYEVPGQKGINLAHPALRSPIDGVVTNAGQGTDGRIAIRDANGFTHEILHSYTRQVAVGDPVVAG